MIMENSITWLLVADASKARIFSMHKAKTFTEPDQKNLCLVGEFTHSNSRKKNSELTADRQGEFGSSTFGETTSAKTHEAEQFAHELLSQLKTGHQEKNFRDLIIVAPPTFMGILHKHMPIEMNKLVSQKIEKDYTGQSERDLMQSLLNHF